MAYNVWFFWKFRIPNILHVNERYEYMQRYGVFPHDPADWQLENIEKLKAKIRAAEEEEDDDRLLLKRIKLIYFFF